MKASIRYGRSAALVLAFLLSLMMMMPPNMAYAA